MVLYIGQLILSPLPFSLPISPSPSPDSGHSGGEGRGGPSLPSLLGPDIISGLIKPTPAISGTRDRNTSKYILYTVMSTPVRY